MTGFSVIWSLGSSGLAGWNLKRWIPAWELSPAGEQSVRKGEKVISIHIPQGEKLVTRPSVRESHYSGNGFLGKRADRICVIPGCCIRGLKTFCRRKAVIIIQFQNQFQIVETDWDEREAEWRILGKMVQRNLQCTIPEEHISSESCKEISEVRKKCWGAVWEY